MSGVGNGRVHDVSKIFSYFHRVVLFTHESKYAQYEAGEKKNINLDKGALHSIMKILKYYFHKYGNKGREEMDDLDFFVL